jgi:hypothetical protein
MDPYKSQISLYTTRGQQHSPTVSLSSGALGIFLEKSNSFLEKVKSLLAPPLPVQGPGEWGIILIGA